MTPNGGGAGRAVVLHLQGAGPGVVRTGLRAARNVRVELPDARMELVVQGPAAGVLVTDPGLSAEAIDHAAELGLGVLLCRNSLAGLELPPDDVPSAFGVVPAALAHCALRQWEGWAYLRL